MKNTIAFLFNFLLLIPLLKAQEACTQAIIDEYVRTLPDHAEIAIGHDGFLPNRL